MRTDLVFRAATPGDISDLVILSDMATRRLSSYLWGLSAKPGQSCVEFGRSFMRAQAEHFSHYSNWSIAELNGGIAGALNCCLLPNDVDEKSLANSPEATRNLNALKMIAGGTWYITAAAVFPEFRNNGIGSSLLFKAEALARARGLSETTLMVGSFNVGALRLYQRHGFEEWDRRPFIPFPGSDPEGFWILMRKAVEP